MDVPTAVVVMARDRVVPLRRQLKLAQAIPGATVHQVDADHAVCVTAPQVFTPVLLQACWSVDAASRPARQARACRCFVPRGRLSTSTRRRTP